MKKWLFLLLSVSLFVGCGSLSRKPAGQENPLIFELSGRSESVSPDYYFQLLSLRQAQDQKVEFQEYKLSEPSAIAAVEAWQSELQKDLPKLKESQGFNFKFEQGQVKVDSDQIELVASLLQRVDKTGDEAGVKVRKKIEIMEAFNENFRPPSQYYYGAVLGIKKLISLQTGYTFPITEAKKINVESSSVWQPRKAEDVDLFYGPGAHKFEELEESICEYKGAKKGYGVHAGFKVRCGRKKLKVKFGNEIYSGPFNSRIYHRLGYNVPVIHYAKALKVRYDRRILSEINFRKSIHREFSFLGAKLFNYDRLRTYDANEFVKEAVLANGQRLSGKEFKAKLVKTCVGVCDYGDQNINSEFEKSIDHLVLVPSTVTDDPKGEELGFWSYSNLDHFDRPEIRALAILGAWTGNFDLRKKNTSVYWNSETNEIKHFISDPGSGLGESFQLVKSSSQVQDMNWKAIYLTGVQEGFKSIPSVNVSFAELEKNEAFRRLTYNEARWMAERIAEISEEEISAALAATGMSAAEFLLAREKLLSIQQNMIKSFKIHGSPTLRHRVINKRLNYNPSRDKVEIKLRDGRIFRFENRGFELRNGQLLKNGPVETD